MNIPREFYITCRSPPVLELTGSQSALDSHWPTVNASQCLAWSACGIEFTKSCPIADASTDKQKTSVFSI